MYNGGVREKERDRSNWTGRHSTHSTAQTQTDIYKLLVSNLIQIYNWNFRNHMKANKNIELHLPYWSSSVFVDENALQLTDPMIATGINCVKYECESIL